MKTAVVILNWNGREYLEKFLPGVVASVGGESEVIVADNASSDGSVEMLKEKFPAVKTMVFSKNHGFTGGYNRALLQLDAEYFLLLNSDIEVSQGWLEPLQDWMDNHPDCGICAPKLRSYHERTKFEYAGAAGGLLDKYGYPYCRGRVMNMVEEDRGQYDNIESVFWVSGACLMIRSELYRSLAGLDERFFAHMEEIDLCWRAQLIGYKVCVIPESVVWHIGGGSLPNKSAKKLYLNYRNNLIMLRKNLAKTLALRLYHQGQKRSVCAAKAVKKAGRMIFIRMLMDGASAVVYFLTGKWSYVKAVVTAHQDFRKMHIKLSESELSAYLKEYGKKGRIEGMSHKWMVPEALRRRLRLSRRDTKNY